MGQQHTNGFVERPLSPTYPEFASYPPLMTPRYDGPYYRHPAGFYPHSPTSPHPHPYAPHIDSRVSQLQDQMESQFGRLFSFMENTQAQMRQSQGSRQMGAESTPTRVRTTPRVANDTNGSGARNGHTENQRRTPGHFRPQS